MIDITARLISTTYHGQLGKMVAVETDTPIFADLSSVGRVEFYKAYDSGFKPEFRITTDPVNYAGQTVVDVDTPEGEVRCDIYRTYRKSQDAIELWCVKKNPDAVQVFTLWTAGKRVILHGAYLTGTDGVDRQTTGAVATDTVSLILPQTLKAFVGEAAVGYVRPKAYAAMTAAEQAESFYIDNHSFFALGEIEAEGKYQAINAAYDDVYLVQSVNRRNRRAPDTEYLEVIGR